MSRYVREVMITACVVAIILAGVWGVVSLMVSAREQAIRECQAALVVPCKNGCPALRFEGDKPIYICRPDTVCYTCMDEKK